MLTVKHIGYDIETITEATDIRAERGTYFGSTDLKEVREVGLVVRVWTPRGEERTFDSGDLFVMNDSGKTVGDYHWNDDKKNENVG